MANVSMRQVAEKAGTSTATVSRVLNGTSPVSEMVQVRVRQAVEELGYLPSSAAKSLRLRRSGMLGLVLPSLRNPFFPELIESVTTEAASRGYGILIAVSENPTDEVIRMVRSSTVDGIVLVGATSGHDAMVAVNEITIPVVAFDRAPAEMPTTVYSVDNELGAAQITRHLISKGHKRIAHISGPLGLGVSEQRLSGFRLALAEAGLDDHPELRLAGDFTEESGYAAVIGLLGLAEPPTAIFAANDMMAIGVLSALRQIEGRPARAVAVAGFDGLTISRYVSPRLTTYRQPIEQLALLCIQRLLHAVDAKDPGLLCGPNGEQIMKRLPGEMIIGESSDGVFMEKDTL